VGGQRLETSPRIFVLERNAACWWFQDFASGRSIWLCNLLRGYYPEVGKSMLATSTEPQPGFDHVT